MHRLMPRPHVPRVEPRGHGLDALPLAREAQPGEVGPQRLVPIPVPQRLRQPLHVLTEPLLSRIARFGCPVPTLAWDPATDLTFVTQ